MQRSENIAEITMAIIKYLICCNIIHYEQETNISVFFSNGFREISLLRVFKVTKIKIYHIICYDVRLYFSIRKTIDNQQKENFLISSIYRTQKLIALRRFMLPGFLQKKRNQSYSTCFSFETNSLILCTMLGQTELR